jgi:hypothetical protein
MSLEILCPEHLEAVRAFADRLGPAAREDLEERLGYLANYGGAGRTVCRLVKDFAPQSFRFVMSRVPPDGGPPLPWFDGGLIYHGPGSSGGAFPTLAVDVGDDPRPHWSVHT